MRPRALMTAYAEGSIISRELREMLSQEAEADRFDRELARLDAQCGNEFGGLYEDSFGVMYDEIHHGRD